MSYHEWTEIGRNLIGGKVAVKCRELPSNGRNGERGGAAGSLCELPENHRYEEM
jgi:hypothetical protein